MKTINYILIGVTCFILMATFIGGCQYGKSRIKCNTTTDTTYIHDTTDHYIYAIWPWYTQSEDSIIYQLVPADVDTAAILKDHFAKHIFTRNWWGVEGKDSLLHVNVIDTISKNTPIGNVFTYKILRPQTIVNNITDNSITYNKYIYGGVNIPIYPFKNINYTALELFYAFPKGYTGLMWQPEIKTFSAKLGVKFLQFKQKQ
jgi:hypothetical protein